MAGLYDTDIKLDELWQLSPASTGDAAQVSDFDCILQDIKLEALSQEGELFYDKGWGWSLVDFVQSEDDDLTVIEIQERVKEKLGQRETIDKESISVNVIFKDDAIYVQAAIRFYDSSVTYDINVSIDRINVEVVMND
jgi:hypothetical protein